MLYLQVEEGVKWIELKKLLKLNLVKIDKERKCVLEFT